MDSMTQRTAQDIHATCNTEFQRLLCPNKEIYKDIKRFYHSNPKKTNKVCHIAYCIEDKLYHLMDGFHSITAAKDECWKGKFWCLEETFKTRKEVCAEIIKLNNTIHFSTAKKFSLDLDVIEIIKPIAVELTNQGLFEKAGNEKAQGITYMTVGDMFCSFVGREIFTNTKIRASFIKENEKHIPMFILHLSHLAAMKNNVTNKKTRKKFNEISFLIGYSATGRLSREEYTTLSANTVENLETFSILMKQVSRGTDKPKAWRSLFIKASVL